MPTRSCGPRTNSPVPLRSPSCELQSPPGATVVRRRPTWTKPGLDTAALAPAQDVMLPLVLLSTATHRQQQLMMPPRFLYNACGHHYYMPLKCRLALQVSSLG